MKNAAEITAINTGQQEDALSSKNTGLLQITDRPPSASSLIEGIFQKVSKEQLTAGVMISLAVEAPGFSEQVKRCLAAKILALKMQLQIGENPKSPNMVFVGSTLKPNKEEVTNISVENDCRFRIFPQKTVTVTAATAATAVSTSTASERVEQQKVARPLMIPHVETSNRPPLARQFIEAIWERVSHEQLIAGVLISFDAEAPAVFFKECTDCLVEKAGGLKIGLTPGRTLSVGSILKPKPEEVTFVQVGTDYRFKIFSAHKTAAVLATAVTKVKIG